ncbi:hypothetical protein [Candidatus Hecatella orcuttiae]|jgi:hypothetical protein|uniref:hypothetical protein n=1 Tax=Candidatus Hecatella orcuttiae TaxID=1935119 RepID=UPI0028683748|nr:hypothetical protein [Candidatus Hecatella orcuttiae]
MHEVEVKILQKPLRVPKEKLGELKGTVSGSLLSRMKKEAVDCPVKGETLPFIECFTCENFLRRVKGHVHCRG